MAGEKKYSGYGYHGGGRKATGIKRVSICISGQPEQIEKLKKMAAAENMTVSAYIFQLANINKNEKIENDIEVYQEQMRYEEEVFAEEMERQRIANYDFERGDVKY